MKKADLIHYFKDHWYKHYSYISLELTDTEIWEYIERCEHQIKMACDYASDYLLSQGLADVQE